MAFKGEISAARQLNSVYSLTKVRPPPPPPPPPNFVVEIETGSALTTLTVSFAIRNISAPMNQSVAGGNSLESGKFYQVVGIGSCWTLTEFLQTE